MSFRVLIVDDSGAQIRQLKDLVSSSAGFEVVATAQTGADGIKMFEQHHPDIVLLDVVMPVMDGLACLRTLRTLDSKIPVVMITSVGGVKRVAEEARKFGAVEVITKPFDPAMIQAALQNISSSR